MFDIVVMNEDFLQAYRNNAIFHRLINLLTKQEYSEKEIVTILYELTKIISDQAHNSCPDCLARMDKGE